jgi:oligoribonuclease NrnB/cAMP/cGMP phosphodiesterase (DHH superfamily)
MKIKLFTHNDLDGVGAAMVAYATFGEENVDVEYHNYDSLHTSLLEFVTIDENGNRKSDEYKSVFITDISPRDTLVIDTIDEVIGHKLQLLDHHNDHKAVDYLREHSWTNIYATTNGVTKCGTDLMYEAALEINLDASLLSKDFIKLVHDLDTWEWKDTNNIKAIQFDNLLDIYGIDYFIERFLPQLEYGKDITFDYVDIKMLERYEKRKLSYIERQKEKLIKKEIDGKTVGVVFATAHQSELGNILANENLDVDYIAMVNFNGISFRGIKDDINLGQIALLHGGGGHPKAAGCSVSDEKKQQILDILLKV